MAKYVDVIGHVTFIMTPITGLATPH